MACFLASEAFVDLHTYTQREIGFPEVSFSIYILFVDGQVGEVGEIGRIKAKIASFGQYVVVKTPNSAECLEFLFLNGAGQLEATILYFLHLAN